MVKNVGRFCAGLFFMIGSVVGEEFSDDFAQAANTNWITSAENIVMKFENGSCSLANSDVTYTGFALHSLSSKPSTFTLSATVTLSDAADQSAGFICCLAESGMATGYYVAIDGNENISVNKIGASGSSVNIITKGSAYLLDGANILKVSKKETTFNVFCNGHFVATFTDGDFSSGNIALLVSPKSSAVFDDVVFTETFEEGAAPTCFGDNFDDGDLIGWDSFGSDGVAVENRDSAMHISTNAGQNTYQVIDLPLENFILRTVVSHHGGSTNNLYGLFICGTAETTIPLAGFSINGNRNYATFLSGQGQTQLNQNSKVKGAAYVSGTDTVFYKDTLEVLKREGSQEYLFIINGDTLSRFTGVNFTVTGAGVFCLDSIMLVVDDFVVAEGSNPNCSIRQHVQTGRVKPITQYRSRIDRCTFDALGRIISHPTTASLQHHAAGVHIIREDGISRIQINTRR